MTQEDNARSAQKLPSKGFVAMLYIPLLVPALLPLYFAADQDDPALVAVMVGTAITVLIFNAVILVVAYRWLAQGADQ